ncbi:hypothetical protein [Streptomyces ziwulingensis]|uniref:DUF4254 domain-containing protein n=1 Tax=Streptomyces ziwulingensis TaxID=1045501 RepID=A0ABP9AL69_9ACTN
MPSEHRHAPSGGSNARPPPSPPHRRRHPHRPGADLHGRTTHCRRPQGPAIHPTSQDRPEPLPELSGYLKDSEDILSSWDAYSDENTDLDGWPLDDDAYGRRASARDASTADAFEAVRDSAHHLLATAQAQLGRLPGSTMQPRWVWQLGVLQDALERLDALEEEWQQTRGELPAGAGPGSSVYDDALAEHHAECWSYLDDWATQGHALIEIHTAARNTPSPLAPPPTTAPAPSMSQAGKVRR